MIYTHIQTSTWRVVSTHFSCSSILSMYAIGVYEYIPYLYDASCLGTTLSCRLVLSRCVYGYEFAFTLHPWQSIFVTYSQMNAAAAAALMCMTFRFCYFSMLGVWVWHCANERMRSALAHFCVKCDFGLAGCAVVYEKPIYEIRKSVCFSSSVFFVCVPMFEIIINTHCARIERPIRLLPGTIS